MSYDVGARLKHVREMQGLSQRELARRAGVTNGLISLIEQNRVSPSVGSLKKVLDGVPMSMADFFTLDVNSAAQVFYAADELVEIGNEAASLRLVAAQRPGRQLTVLHERYEPDAATGDDMLSHRGEEGGVVVRGKWNSPSADRRACSKRAMPTTSPVPRRIAFAMSAAKSVRSSRPPHRRPS